MRRPPRIWGKQGRFPVSNEARKTLNAPRRQASRTPKKERKSARNESASIALEKGETRAFLPAAPSVIRAFRLPPVPEALAELKFGEESVTLHPMTGLIRNIVTFITSKNRTQWVRLFLAGLILAGQLPTLVSGIAPRSGERSTRCCTKRCCCPPGHCVCRPHPSGPQPAFSCSGGPEEEIARADLNLRFLLPDPVSPPAIRHAHSSQRPPRSQTAASPDLLPPSPPPPERA
jgi:hypothetical protein